jgi:hypothetical protein
LAEIQDVERAFHRAAVLRRIGLNAIPVVGGREWTNKVIGQALTRGVLMATNGHLDWAAWEGAWASLQNTQALTVA